MKQQDYQHLYGRDEMNLVEFPFAKLNPKDNRGVIEYEGWFVDENGQNQRQRWVVRGAHGLGLPSELGERIIIALLALTAEQGFTEPKVEFSVYQLLKMLGISRSKKSYKLIEDQLNRLMGITIHSENAFWDHEAKKRITTKKAFHLIDNVWLRFQEGQSIKSKDAVYGYMVWGEVLWKSFQAGYIKSLNLDFYYRLPTPLSRRLFRFLDKRMKYQETYEIDIFSLANRLGCVRYTSPSSVKRIIMPACEKLIDEGFLAEAECIKFKKYTRVRFVKAKPASETANVEPVALILTDDAYADERWQRVLGLLQNQMTKSTFDSWLRGTQVVHEDPETHSLTIGVRNTQAKDWLDHRMHEMVEQAVQSIWDDVPTSVVFEVF